MTIEEMKRRKTELGYSYELIADYSEVPLGTVQKIFTGVTKAPRRETIQKLEKLLLDPTRNPKGLSGSTEPMLMREGAAEYHTDKRQGEYTLKDYYELPDDKRYELIDGVLYDMASPWTLHQMIGQEIWAQLMSYIREKKGQCIPLIAPLDVQLDCDEKTMVQPDVMVVCDRDKLINRCVYGAPDFVVEVLSDSTRKKDMSLKLSKYSQAGVREYWVIDYKKKKVLVYDLENDEFPTIYGFDQEIPVVIFAGECKIDFPAIYEYIAFMYDKMTDEWTTKE